MYDENLANRILDILFAAFPDKMMFDDLRNKAPEFRELPEEQWFRALEALRADGLIDGKFLRTGMLDTVQHATLLVVNAKGRQQVLSTREAQTTGKVSLAKGNPSSQAPKTKDITFVTAFEQYTVRQTIGNGGAGTVYDVIDEDGKHFALKLLNHSADTRKTKRFKNEISFCYRNVHPNVIRVLDYGAAISGEESRPFYVMPLYPSTLRKLMESNPTQSAERMRLFGQILDGVEAAHLQGVVHRDLKPENILFDSSDGTLVVADFGIARFKEEDLHTAVETHNRERLANFLYSAPEQRERGKDVGCPADVYALGLIFNELFTAQVPQGAGFKRIGEVSSDHAFLDALVDEMIQQDPTKRPDSIKTIKLQLISRGQDFVRLQELSRLKDTVFAETVNDDSLITDPLKLVGVDYDNGMLKLTLSQAPNAAWIRVFVNLGNFAAVYGKEPSRFTFSTDEATIPATEDDAQIIVNHFKNYLAETNRLYALQIETARLQQIEERDRKLRESVVRLEKERRTREAILKNIRI
jgi:serine/threonine protein kinase